MEHADGQERLVLADIRQIDDDLSTGERLIGYVMTLAKGDRLTPERLMDDAEAILGLSEWAAEHEQWERLLELVKALQACFEIAHRIEQWLELLEHGLSAARALGDDRSEVWMLRQLASTSVRTEDTAAARRYSEQADKLQASYERAPPSESEGEQNDSIAHKAATTGGTGSTKVALWTLGLIAATIAGGASGYLVGHADKTTVRTTTQLARYTVGRKTVTSFRTVTLPATTVLDTTIVTTTDTTTATTPPPAIESERRALPSRTSG